MDPVIQPGWNRLERVHRHEDPIQRRHQHGLRHGNGRRILQWREQHRRIRGSRYHPGDGDDGNRRSRGRHIHHIRRRTIYRPGDRAGFSAAIEYRSDFHSRDGDSHGIRWSGPYFQIFDLQHTDVIRGERDSLEYRRIERQPWLAGSDSHYGGRSRRT